MPNVPGIFQIGSYEMIVLQVLMLAGIFGAITAKAKGRSGFLWFLISVVTCGAGLVIVLLLPRVQKGKSDDPDYASSWEDDSSSSDGSD